MQIKAAALFVEVGAGSVTVAELCRRLQISRQTYYKYRRRLAEEGPPGLLERSRRPRVSPSATSAELVEAIVATRAQLATEGWDDGATSIRYRLLAEGNPAPPSVRTIHRVLVRAHLVVPQPRKRPRSSFRRFEFPCTDDCWQIDGWQSELADGTHAVVLDIIDDTTRYLLTSYVCAAETTANAWAAMAHAIRRYGPPRCVLSDNSRAFTGRLTGDRVAFENNLLELGITAIHASPKHPQTCGKNERSHQTAQRWLAAHPAPRDHDQLQALLEQYRQAYNERPHQALDGRSPLQQRGLSRRHPSSPAATGTTPATTPAPPVRVTTPTANRDGIVRVGHARLGLGAEYAHQSVVVFTTDDDVRVYYQAQQIYRTHIRAEQNYYPVPKRDARNPAA